MKHDPKALARKLLRKFYPTEKDLASVSINGEGRHVSAKIPEDLLDAIVGMLSIQFSSRFSLMFYNKSVFSDVIETSRFKRQLLVTFV